MGKEYDLLTVGFPMVEIMRKDRGVRFEEPSIFLGPYPSADTCILLDVAAHLGLKCCLLGVTGDDAFSNVVLDRLKKDGVDISRMIVAPGEFTTAVFVRYEPDGRREYLSCPYGYANRKFGKHCIDADAIKKARAIHFSGEIILMCSQGEEREALLNMLSLIPDDVVVTLDPNYAEYDDERAKELFAPFIERANIILPSEVEAKNMMRLSSDDEACKELAQQGKTVALKCGSKGCVIYKGDQVVSVPAYKVEEVDPTGCGDSFCAGFITGTLEGKTLLEIGRLANAAGALQATKFGPMEGAMPREIVDDLILSHM